MKRTYFHGTTKRHTYFEGWYFKHSAGENTIAFIPGMNVDAHGTRSAFLQVVSNAGVHVIDYPYSQFYASPKKLEIVVGDNYFSSDGIVIDIKTDDLSLTGAIRYQNFTPLESDIMGPFRFVPVMQCNHGVESLRHDLSGELLCNRVPLCFDRGVGYIEQDWGSSFPQTYVWTQANDLGGTPSCIMLSVADVPLGPTTFRGVIGVILAGGTQYRLATYRGAHIRECTREKMIIEQGQYLLEVFSDPSAHHLGAQPLKAPQRGDMTRVIKENVACATRYRFSMSGTVLFDEQSDTAGFEFVD